MKKNILLFIISMLVTSHIMAQDASAETPHIPKPEMQISVGQSLGLAVLKEKNTVWFPMGGNDVYPFEYDLVSRYFIIVLLSK